MRKRLGMLNPSRCSVISPRRSVVSTAPEPIGNPTALSHSPSSTSRGTFFGDAVIGWNASGIRDCGDFRFDGDLDTSDSA
jgi:hypothetical protein